MTRAKALFMYLSPRRTNTMSNQLSAQLMSLQAALVAEMRIVRLVDNLTSERAESLCKEIERVVAEMKAAEEVAYRKEEMRLLNLKLAKCCSVVGCITLLLCSWGILRSWGVHQLSTHKGDNPTVVDISK
jgi:hypothetical protein